MTRLSALHVAVACLLIGAIAGSEIVARPSGIEAPELAQLSEAQVGREIAGRIYAVLPDSVITIRGVGIAGWNGCWDCPARPGAIDDTAATVPLSGAIWAASTAFAALAATWLLGRWRSSSGMSRSDS